MRRSWKNFACFVAVAAWSSLGAAPSHAATLKIDHAEAPDFEKDKKIVVFFDLLDQQKRVVPDLKAEEITSVLIDDVAVDGTKTVQTFAEAKEWVGLAVLIAGHRSYTEVADEEDNAGTEEDAGGKAAAGALSTFDRCKRGTKQLLEKLSGNDQVAVFQYSEAGSSVVAQWTSDFASVSSKVSKMEPPYNPKSEKVDVVAPRFYKVLNSVLKKVVKKIEGGEFPRRRILLVLTDGTDFDLAQKPKKAEKAVESIAKLANENDIKIYGVGYNDDPTPLSVFQGLVGKTKGSYREVAVPEKLEEEPEVAATIESMGEEIKQQYVLTFEPNLDQFRGAEKPVEIRIETKKNNEDAGGEIENIAVAVIPTDIWPIIMWVLIGLGSLLGIFLLIKMIKAIIAARANRPVEYVEEDSGPVGPYKGKLTVLEGTYVGAEFYLTDDVTTIGAMDGNNIVLEAPGVSKRHAGIKIEDMRFELADFGSTNGTHVNGNKITKQFLRDQDIISIGDCRMKFSLK